MNTLPESIYKVYTEKDPEFQRQEVPEVGTEVEYRGGYKFAFCTTQYQLSAASVVSCPSPFRAKMGIPEVDLYGNWTEFTIKADKYFKVNRLKHGCIILCRDGKEPKSYTIMENKSTNADGHTSLRLSSPLLHPLEREIKNEIYVFYPPRRGIEIGGREWAIGIAVTSTTANIDNYFWVQTRGPAAVRAASPELSKITHKPISLTTSGIFLNPAKQGDRIVGFSTGVPINNIMPAYIDFGG